MSATEERFWGRVSTEGVCWEWTGGTNGRYGQMGIDGTVKMAHRISYEYLVGSIPTGMVLDHLCKNTLCVNPDHMEPVTQKVNVNRGALKHVKTRQRSDYCKRGHQFDEANTYLSNGRRHCRACRKAAKSNV